MVFCLCPGPSRGAFELLLSLSLCLSVSTRSIFKQMWRAQTYENTKRDSGPLIFTTFVNKLKPFPTPLPSSLARVRGRSVSHRISCSVYTYLLQQYQYIGILSWGGGPPAREPGGGKIHHQTNTPGGIWYTCIRAYVYFSLHHTRSVLIITTTLH